MTSIGSDLTLKVTAPPRPRRGRLMVKTAADFDDSMRKVAAVTGSHRGPVRPAPDRQAIDLGASTAWSASVRPPCSISVWPGSTNEIHGGHRQMLSLASAGAMELGAGGRYRDKRPLRV